MKGLLLVFFVLLPLAVAQPLEDSYPDTGPGTGGPGDAGYVGPDAAPAETQPAETTPAEQAAPPETTMPATQEPTLPALSKEEIAALVALPRELTNLRQQVTAAVGQLVQQQAEVKADLEAIKTQLAGTDEAIKGLKADTAQIKSTLSKPPVVEEPSAVGTVLLWLLAIVTLAAIGTVVGIQVRKRRARKAAAKPTPAARPMPRPLPRTLPGPAPGRLVSHAAPMPPPPAFAAVRTYLQDAVKTGSTIAAAREELVKSGWNPEQVDAAVREMQGRYR
ncbi:hypothetical protein HY642_01075 [Candidatus Woesearchaeota archaeon]|nr:hypothetical protein [Candidatus Woesearchaeota archaeon]